MMQFNFEDFLHRRNVFSLDTFGPGKRHQPVIDHIRKELVEIEATPDDLEEWIDVLLLAFDGAWRCTGAQPEEVIEMLEYKVLKNQNRKWPDWRTADPDKAIEHLRE